MSDRLAELKRFWYIAGQIGTENAYDVIEGLYGHRSLRRLTIDEMETVVSELLEKTGIKLRSKKKKTYLTKKFFQEAGYKVNISNGQRNLISVLYDQAGVTKSHFIRILEHVAPENYIGPKQAGKVIGALHNIINRAKATKEEPPVIFVECEKAPKEEPPVILASPAGQKVRINTKGFVYFEHLEGNG